MEACSNIKNIMIISLFFTTIFLITLISCRESLYIISFSSLFSKITIKINSSGNQRIISSQYNFLPDSVLLNGTEIQLQNSREYNFQYSFNNIELIWNNTLTDCSKMFSGCLNIVEIDLSQFNGTYIQTFNNMFENCISLTSIILINLDTSAANDMSFMFFNCSKITSLNLSSFNTYLVKDMTYMFYGCESLKYLNLSNFKTPNLVSITSMFHNCKSLESIDLLNFNTSLVTNMSLLFSECEKLTYLDLKSLFHFICG